MMESRLLKTICLFVIGVSILISQPFSALAAKITDIRFWSAPDHTRIVLDLTDAIQYESMTREKPPQLILELKGSLHIPKKEVQVNDPCLTKITLTIPRKDRVKIVFQQRKPLQVNIFPLKPYQDKPHRLVVDLVDPTQEKREQDERARQKEIRPKGAKTVVVDPGHGGEDPGAVGSGKTMEKDIALKVGEKLIQQLNHGGEIKAFLTRKGDYFVPLPDRIRISREYGADLFISLHTDGSFSPQMRGSSVYCLSLSGATDQASKILADKENMSDILGGAFAGPKSVAKDPNLNQILLDLMQNNSMKEGFRFAELLLENLREVNHLKFPGYRQANFIVLRAPDIPSVLVEMAYITNRDDERLLLRNDFQEKIARTINVSVRKYFQQ